MAMNKTRAQEIAHAVITYTEMENMLEVLKAENTDELAALYDKVASLIKAATEVKDAAGSILGGRLPVGKTAVAGGTVNHIHSEYKDVDGNKVKALDDWETLYGKDVVKDYVRVTMKK